MRTIVFGTVWLGVVGAALAYGFDYYRLPVADRPYSDAHDLFASTGTMGLAYGIAGSLMMAVGVAMYSLRKRWHRIGRLGKLRSWLRVHIFLCTLGPALILLHTAFRFGGVVAIAFWSMMAVVLSGVFGRYVYVRLPRSGQGSVIAPVALKRRQIELSSRVKTAAPLSETQLDRLLGHHDGDDADGLGRALWRAVRYDFDRRRLPWRLRAELDAMGIPASVADGLVTELVAYRDVRQQLLAFRPFQRLFGYWHVFHLPLATAMMLIVLLHVGVAVAFGYAWAY